MSLRKTLLPADVIVLGFACSIARAASATFATWPRPTMMSRSDNSNQCMETYYDSDDRLYGDAGNDNGQRVRFVEGNGQSGLRGVGWLWRGLVGSVRCYRAARRGDDTSSDNRDAAEGDRRGTAVYWHRWSVRTRSAHEVARGNPCPAQPMHQGGSKVPERSSRIRIGHSAARLMSAPQHAEPDAHRGPPQ